MRAMRWVGATVLGISTMLAGCFVRSPAEYQAQREQLGRRMMECPSAQIAKLPGAPIFRGTGCGKVFDYVCRGFSTMQCKPAPTNVKDYVRFLNCGTNAKVEVRKVDTRGLETFYVVKGCEAGTNGRAFRCLSGDPYGDCSELIADKAMARAMIDGTHKPMTPPEPGE